MTLPIARLKVCIGCGKAMAYCRSTKVRCEGCAKQANRARARINGKKNRATALVSFIDRQDNKDPFIRFAFMVLDDKVERYSTDRFKGYHHGSQETYLQKVERRMKEVGIL